MALGKTWVIANIITSLILPLTVVVISYKFYQKFENDEPQDSDGTTNVDVSAFELRDRNAQWDTLAGLEDAKESIEGSAILQLKNPDEFDEYDIDPPTGVLLYGPPGTGKTQLIEALSNKLDTKILKLTPSQVMSRWYGETERIVHTIFEYARQNQPMIIFVDELDTIAPNVDNTPNSAVSRRKVAQFQIELDEISKEEEVAIVATTNYPDRIDPSLIRPGRFDRLVRVHAPDKETRFEILKIHAAGIPVDEAVLKRVAEQTAGYVGSDLEAIVKQVIVSGIQEGDIDNADLDDVTYEDFKEALDTIAPTMDSEVESYYDEMEEDYGTAKDVMVSSSNKGFQ